LVNAASITALRQDLAAEALRLGFAACGIAPAAEDPLRAARLEQWLGEGLHGGMDWMESRAHHRRSPQGLWGEARSVIALGMSYAPARDPLALADQPDRARISVYAQGGDYHDTVKKALKALARWLVAETQLRGLGDAGVKVFVDTAPVMEKPLGEAAGLGWQGKHTNLVSREHGSWLFLGAIYTTLAFEPDAPGRDRCGSCDAGQRACPTAAFPAPYQLDARRCISYLTIELKDSIPEDLRPLIGNRVLGCDDCQLACPWNKFAQRSTLPDFDVRNGLDSASLADLFAWTEADFNTRLEGSAIRRIGHERWLRNIAVALGNAAQGPAAKRGDPALVAALRSRAAHPSALVREHVRWALGQHGLSA